MYAPAGSAGGQSGVIGVNHIIAPDGTSVVADKGTFTVSAGTRLRMDTPGGGGYGAL
ncbi:MAG: hydantoinase B/oxoprolinase family protein [Roseiflexaceae bacterium]